MTRSPIARAAAATRTTPVAERVRGALSWLERRGSKRNRDGMARYAIRAPKAFGVSMGTMQTLAKRLGRDHELALALWDTGWYEARILASFVDEPARVTPRQMDRWCGDFDNWAICDTTCMHLFDRTPYAWRKVEAWARRRTEFQKRAAFALLASLSLHDRHTPDAAFRRGLELVEAAAGDSRNFVKKGVNWALRSIGRRTAPLNRAAVTVARRLAASQDPAARWIGKDALRELTSATAARQIAARESRVVREREATRRRAAAGARTSGAVKRAAKAPRGSRRGGASAGVRRPR